MRHINILESLLVHEPNLENLIVQVESLNSGSKALLIKRLLGDGRISVTFGGNVLNTQVIIQVNAIDKSAIADILETVARKIKASYDQKCHK